MEQLQKEDKIEVSKIGAQPIDMPSLFKEKKWLSISKLSELAYFNVYGVEQITNWLV